MGTKSFALFSAPVFSASLFAAICIVGSGCKKPITDGPMNTTDRPSESAKGTPGQDAQKLSFAIDEGELSNRFVRDTTAASHVLTRSGTRPRIVAAFPAGNSGAGIWFRQPDQPVELTLGTPQTLKRDGLRGVTFEVTADADQLVIEQVVSSSVRILRDYMLHKKLPGQYQQEVEVQPSVARWSRPAVDKETRYTVEVAPLEQSAGVTRDGDVVAFARQSEGVPMRLLVTILNDEPSLTPIPKSELVTEDAVDDPEALNALAFLSYREKMLAGSWRFLTYFGRDTLLSVRLLMPVLQPGAVEAGLGSVLDRLSKEGEVAHEEDIGEFVALHHQARGYDSTREPIFDYTMIDDDLILAPVVASYLLEDQRGAARAVEFVQRKTPDGRTYQEALRANIDFVLGAAAPYSDDPKPANLISLPDGKNTGEWRDSEEGLAWGRYPYNVNVALMPAALEAAARLLESDLLGDPDAAAKARAMLPAWAKVYEHYEVELPVRRAKKNVLTYAATIGLDTDLLEQAFPAEPVVLEALVLDAKHQPIPVMHSDFGFSLLFGEPSPERLERFTHRIEQPFPIGLRTGVGVVVANATHAGPKLQKIFTPNNYHGAVVWSWQQAMMAEGLARQLRRDDLPESTRSALQSAQKTLWSLIEENREIANEELWSWRWEEGDYQLSPFGQQGGDVTESNAAQLWSTVYLSVRPHADQQ